MGWRWRQKWVGLGLKVRGLGWRQVAEERWVNIWVGELDQQGVEEDKKKKWNGEEYLVAWAGGKWRKRWVGTGQGRWIAQRLGKWDGLERWRKREKIEGKGWEKWGVWEERGACNRKLERKRKICVYVCVCVRARLLLYQCSPLLLYFDLV